ncbi:MAG: hypothetical protein K2X03_10985 [Bryobacteraceae bacterium]|nr:hypothetical protein [Bryobacteraceae bacterium]
MGIDEKLKNVVVSTDFTIDLSKSGSNQRVGDVQKALAKIGFGLDQSDTLDDAFRKRVERFQDLALESSFISPEIKGPLLRERTQGTVGVGTLSAVNWVALKEKENGGHYRGETGVDKGSIEGMLGYINKVSEPVTTMGQTRIVAEVYGALKNLISPSDAVDVQAPARTPSPSEGRGL